MTARSIKVDVLIGGLDDWADAGWVMQTVRQSRLLDPEELRSLAIGVITELLVEGLVVAGDITLGAHDPWQCTSGEAVVRITREWLRWGSEVPTPASVVWLANTDAGDAVARAALAKEENRGCSR